MDTEQLLLFCELTNAGPEQASQYLKLAEHDLDLAVQLYYSSQDSDRPIVPSSSSSSSSSSRLSNPSYSSSSSSSFTRPNIPTATTRTTPSSRNNYIQLDEDITTQNDYVVDLSSDLENNDLDNDDDAIPSPLKRTFPLPVSFSSSNNATTTNTTTSTSSYPSTTTSSSFSRSSFVSNVLSQPSMTFPSSSTSSHFRSVPNPFNQHMQPFVSSSSSASSSSSMPYARDSKESKLADLFRPPTEIIFRGSFDYAKQHGKVEKKWILIDLQDPQEFACQVLNRDLWKSPQLQELIQANFLFLQFYLQEREGQQYQSFYPVHSFPHVAILDPRTGERMKLLTLADLTSPGYTMIALANFLEDFSLDPPTFTSIPSNSNSSFISSSSSSNPSNSNSNSNSSSLSPLSTSMNSTTDSLSSSVNNPIHNDDPIALLTPYDPPDPPSSTTTTSTKSSISRVQIRLPDGTRFVKQFDSQALVSDIYRYLKFKSPEYTSQPFALLHVRENLISMLNKSILDAGLNNAAISLVLT